MNLAHDWPRLSPVARERVLERLRTGCPSCREERREGDETTGRFAALVMLPCVDGTKQIRLQCQTCGRYVGGALPIAEHPDWKSYPPRDEGKGAAYREAIEAKRGETLERAVAERRAQLFAERELRREEYAQFLGTAEWRALRDKVMTRAGGVCEACLAAPAEEVHHLTYDLSWLPPATLLWAVCRRCHERLRDLGDRWSEVCSVSRAAIERALDRAQAARIPRAGGEP